MAIPIIKGRRIEISSIKIHHIPQAWWQDCQKHKHKLPTRIRHKYNRALHPLPTEARGHHSKNLLLKRFSTPCNIDLFKLFAFFSEQKPMIIGMVLGIVLGIVTVVVLAIIAIVVFKRYRWAWLTLVLFLFKPVAHLWLTTWPPLMNS